MKKQKNYIGLDLGTGFLGYAVTDENYEIINVNKKRAIGVRVYDEAETAKNRRMFRVARRRLERRKYRICLLQELFAKDMMKEHPNFFALLNESDLNKDDRTLKECEYSLFNDKNFTDKEYYKKYPTIYHLRDELTRTSTDDIRLLYLAIHNIIKYRGNFLTESSVGENEDSFENCKNINSQFKKLCDKLEERQELLSENNFEDDDGVKTKINNISALNLSELDKLNDIIISRDSKKERKEKACEILGANEKYQKLLVGIIFGSDLNITTLFGNGAYEKGTVPPFNFSDNYEDIVVALSSALSDVDFEIVSCLKSIYDWQVLMRMLNGSESLSLAMIKKYEAHQRDLKDLKWLLKNYNPKQYGEMFGKPMKTKNGKEVIDEKNNNYTKYIGGGFVDGKKIEGNGRLGKTCTQEDFYKKVKSVIANISKEPTSDRKLEIVNNILTKIENGEYMPKIVSKNNSTIPYQLNMIELNKILEKAILSGKFKFLNEIEDGYMTAEKIKMLLKFRIPYYVGPIKHYSDEKLRSKNAWAVRKEGRITPWTFDELVDKAESNKEFIDRMTCNCTYLKNAKALPLNSIIYSKYMALSELNKLKIDDVLIDVDLKKAIFDEVYLNGKANKKRIAEFLKEKGYKKFKLSGFDEELKGNMDNYQLFKEHLGDKVDKYPDMIERIIFLMTVHTESGMIGASIEKEFGGKDGILTQEEINEIKGIKFKGWGRLSAEFLNSTNYEKGLKFVDSAGELKSILDLLYDTNENMMQIINNPKYQFKKLLDQYYIDCNIIETNEITYQDVEEMYCSPSVKRCVWQTFLVVKELVKETGSIPQKVFIEVTRKPAEKKNKVKSVPRRQQIENAYKEAQKISKTLEKEQMEHCLEQLKDLPSGELNKEKIFLYFMQLGKCAYSNQPIGDLSNLQDYDIDHIIPQAKKKDDSLNNKVLVRGNLNKNKADIYPLPQNLRDGGKALWDNLHKMKLMSDEKYSRLVRTAQITSDEQEKFINRQLVETNQTALLVNELLERLFNGRADKPVEIVLSKASNVSDFRKEYGLTKSREVNDFHHACDAYLNIVVGNVLNEKYNHSRNCRENQLIEGSQSANFLNTFAGNVWSDREKRNIYLSPKNDKSTLDVVKKQLSSTKFNISYKVKVKQGELFGATIFKADIKDGSKLFSRQESKVDANGIQLHPKYNVAKYGGYSTSGTAYFVVVDSVCKKKSKRTIEAMPIFYDKKIKQGKMTMAQFLNGVLNLEQAKLANIDGLPQSILKVGSLLNFDGVLLTLSGYTDKRLQFHNANELFVDDRTNDYVKELSIVRDKVVKATKVDKNEDDEAKKGDKIAEIDVGQLAEVKETDVEQLTDEEENEVKQLAKEQEKSKKQLEKCLEKCEELIAENKRRMEEENQQSKIVLITCEENLKLYEFFISKLEKKPYKDISTYDSFLKVLKNARSCFEKMNIFEQISTLLNLISAFQCKAPGVDASNLVWEEEQGGKTKQCRGVKNQCIITLKNDISKRNILYIAQSVTGLREKAIKLN